MITFKDLRSGSKTELHVSMHNVPVNKQLTKQCHTYMQWREKDDLNSVCAAFTGTLLSISTERANDYDDSQKDQEKD